MVKAAIVWHGRRSLDDDTCITIRVSSIAGCAYLGVLVHILKNGKHFVGVHVLLEIAIWIWAMYTTNYRIRFNDDCQPSRTSFLLPVCHI